MLNFNKTHFAGLFIGQQSLRIQTNLALGLWESVQEFRAIRIQIPFSRETTTLTACSHWVENRNLNNAKMLIYGFLRDLELPHDFSMGNQLLVEQGRLFQNESITIAGDGDMAIDDAPRPSLQGDILASLSGYRANNYAREAGNLEVRYWTEITAQLVQKGCHYVVDRVLWKTWAKDGDYSRLCALVDYVCFRLQGEREELSIYRYCTISAYCQHAAVLSKFITLSMKLENNLMNLIVCGVVLKPLADELTTFTRAIGNTLDSFFEFLARWLKFISLCKQNLLLLYFKRFKRFLIFIFEIF